MNLNQETKIKNVWYFRNKQPIIEAKRKGETKQSRGYCNAFWIPDKKKGG